MKLAIYWNDRSVTHIARHRVEPEEVEEAVEFPYWTFQGREGTTILLGRTRAGRHLTVVLADSVAEQDAYHVVTARDMTLSERRVFKRKVK